MNIFIPIRGDITVHCDYVFQTANELIKRNHTVYLIAYDYAVVSFPFGKLENHKRDLNEYDFIDQLRYMIPFIRFPQKGIFKKIERIRTLIFLRTVCETMRNLDNLVLWNFYPDDVHLASLAKREGVVLDVVYDCVDNFTSQNDIIDRILKTNEKKLIRIADYVFVNSSALFKLKKKWRNDITLVPQGFDENNFRKKTGMMKRLYHADLYRIPRPRIGFVGNLTYRLDYPLLFDLCKSLPSCSFVFTDSYLEFPNEDMYKNTTAEIEKLRTLDNVYFIPSYTNKTIAKFIISVMDICMIPYDHMLPYNEYCYPMKVFEYFYMGKPVLSTPIAQLKRFHKFVYMGNSVRIWKKHIYTLQQSVWPDKYKRQEKLLAKKNSWSCKIEAILSALHRS